MTATGWPAMTMREARQGAADQRAGRHWAGRCWCGEAHDDATAGRVAPPWAREREGREP